MTFLILLSALLIERFFDWSHIRTWGWWLNYEAWINRHTGSLAPNLKLATVCFPVLAFVFLCAKIFSFPLFGIPHYLFNTLILIYTFGPKNLWLESFSSLTVLKGEANTITNDKIEIPLTRRAGRVQQKYEMADTLFIEGQERIFAVLFWFLLLGPVGAVLYRILILAEASFISAQNVIFIFDFLPARIFAFLFALSGNFMQVFSLWKNMVFKYELSNEKILIDCGNAALFAADKKNNLEKEAIQLIDRSLIIFMVLVACALLMA